MPNFVHQKRFLFCCLAILASLKKEYIPDKISNLKAGQSMKDHDLSFTGPFRLTLSNLN